MSVVVPENIASWRVLEHIGFMYEKKANFYGFDDVAYYVIRRDQFQYAHSFYRIHNSPSPV